MVQVIIASPEAGEEAAETEHRARISKLASMLTGTMVSWMNKEDMTYGDAMFAAGLSLSMLGEMAAIGKISEPDPEMKREAILELIGEALKVGIVCHQASSEADAAQFMASIGAVAVGRAH